MLGVLAFTAAILVGIGGFALTSCNVGMFGPQFNISGLQPTGQDVSTVMDCTSSTRTANHLCIMVAVTETQFQEIVRQSGLANKDIITGKAGMMVFVPLATIQKVASDDAVRAIADEISNAADKHIAFEYLMFVPHTI